jgi:hypothetical protein
MCLKYIFGSKGCQICMYNWVVESQEMIVLPNDPQKTGNIRKSNGLLQATAVILLPIYLRNERVCYSLILQEFVFLFHQTFHEMHTCKTLYFTEIFLFANIHYNNLYHANKILSHIHLLASKNARDLFIIESPTFKCWFDFLKFNWGF